MLDWTYSGDFQHMTNPETQELSVLTCIHDSASESDAGHAAQRDIASRAGLSLGLTNEIIRRLSTKGFVTMRRSSF